MNTLKNGQNNRSSKRMSRQHSWHSVKAWLEFPLDELHTKILDSRGTSLTIQSPHQGTKRKFKLFSCTLAANSKLLTFVFIIFSLLSYATWCTTHFSKLSLQKWHLLESLVVLRLVFSSPIMHGIDILVYMTIFTICCT